MRSIPPATYKPIKRTLEENNYPDDRMSLFNPM